MNFRALREGVGVFASKARSSPTPLRYGFGWLRGVGPSLAEKGGSIIALRRLRIVRADLWFRAFQTF